MSMEKKSRARIVITRVSVRLLPKDVRQAAEAKFLGDFRLPKKTLSLFMGDAATRCIPRNACTLPVHLLLPRVFGLGYFPRLAPIVLQRFPRTAERGNQALIPRLWV